MADWKQITARIRRARGSRDPGGQLALLYEKTNDAMVAFELGRHFEITKDLAKSLEWFLIAATRFRRGEWKTKARDAVVRLGGELPPDIEPAPELTPASSVAAESAAGAPILTIPDPAVPFEQNAVVFESLVAAGSENPPSADTANDAAGSADKKHRRRGRRGGRNRRKSSAGKPVAETHSGSRSPVTTAQLEAAEAGPMLPPRVVDNRAIPRIPVEQVPDTSVPGVKGRFGDPGLASRLSLLEMQLRRLLTCPPAKLEDSSQAPAGPGVFVLTDDEMTTYYYVESCDTLRIAIGSLSRTGMTRRGNTNLKSLLADNLGIPETRAAKYLSDHCVVRWLQLDDGSVNFHHFAIAVLRPILNE